MAYTRKRDQAAAARRHYDRNAPAIKARARAHNKAQTALLLGLMRDLKRAPCTDCGVQYPPYVMEFDHIGNDKTMAVAQMISGGYSVERVLAEIAKCELVCANCHATRTWSRRQ